MDEFSRPATLEDLKLLLRSLHEHGADYLLIGGYALAAHGYQRATTRGGRHAVRAHARTWQVRWRTDETLATRL
jgi:hypothetical protein